MLCDTYTAFSLTCEIAHDCMSAYTQIKENIWFAEYGYRCKILQLSTSLFPFDSCWNIQLEALRERRPPWPRQIITPILFTVKMLSLGCERLPTPLKKKKKKKKKVLDHYLHHDLGMLPLLRCFFAHLLILQYPDHHQNLISSYLYYSGPVHKISSQSVHNFLSNVVHRQTDRQTNATKNITSFAKEVMRTYRLWKYLQFIPTSAEKSCKINLYIKAELITSESYVHN